MTDPADPHYLARKATESEAKRRKISAEVARTAGPNDDIDYLTKRELYSAGLISASELHATGSPQLLPRGWYQYYVEAIDEYCPTRVFSLAEAGPDAADLYDRGYRWIAVFSERTGPSGDRTFIDVRSFAAAAMTEQHSLTEQDALSEILHMGYQIADLPKDIFVTSPTASPQQPTPLPGPGWHPDPTSRFHHRWWDGQRWTHTVALHGQTHTDPI
ncbi:DUF2510 domain-containing protein [Mycolicibacterium stellerae]|uniref:DUF2510 domain-containing protein n=1 Tax=Mycolicibacterium stellerae TaxID=2358193 RepID=UPI001F2A543A|nr:DUF2510 domain-containing protein [Mycolicibacterium stellerae]